MLAAAAIAAGKFIGSLVLPCALQWLLPAVGNQPAVDRTDPRRSLGRQACIGLGRGIPLTSLIFGRSLEMFAGWMPEAFPITIADVNLLGAKNFV